MVWLYSKDLFPNRQSLFYFLLYTVLLVNLGILVTATQTPDNTYNYNTVTVVLLTECVKLLTAIAIYLTQRSITDCVADCRDNIKVCLLYFVPAALYCLTNNLHFINAANYDPTTLFVLLQLKVVVTCICYQSLFKRKLSKIQWLSLVFLTLGCMIKELGRASGDPGFEFNVSRLSSILDYRLTLIFLQVFASCLAGVYTEFLLKDTGSHVSIMTQNVFMYVDSILCNVCVLGYQGQLAEAFTVSSLTAIFKNPLVICLILSIASFGITVSWFLKYLNSVVRNFASALQLIAMALLGWGIFGIAIDVYTVVAIVTVSIATMMYAKNPVSEQSQQANK